MPKRVHTKVAVIALQPITPGHQLLVCCYRIAFETGAYTMTVPCGRVKSGESVAAAAKRLLAEQCGLEVSRADVVPIAHPVFENRGRRYVWVLAWVSPTQLIKIDRSVLSDAGWCSVPVAIRAEAQCMSPFKRYMFHRVFSFLVYTTPKLRSLDIGPPRRRVRSRSSP
ncbi:MAG: NUDIX domain-containing protein [Spirochaetes bacterium]|jgi:8-oxo-dGTP pyrophosphatase MutT (NUDIX family)|nr:NUDIX domain-containing protein [Spirochaetota bacterium]